MKIFFYFINYNLLCLINYIKYLIVKLTNPTYKVFYKKHYIKVLQPIHYNPILQSDIDNMEDISTVRTILSNKMWYFDEIKKSDNNQCITSYLKCDINELKDKYDYLWKSNK